AAGQGAGASMSTKEQRIAAAKKAARARWVPDLFLRLARWRRIFVGRDLASGIVNMGEFRITDKLQNDPRMLRLADNRDARLLFWEALMWADREASDGLIVDVVLPEVARGLHSEQARRQAVDALVAV